MANCSKEYAQELVEKYWEREWKKIQNLPLPDSRETEASESRLINEFKNLQRQADGIDKKSNKGRSEIIHKFHPSIDTANKGGYDSPVEYWKKLQNDSELFKKFLANRYRCSDWYNEKDKTDPEHKRTNRWKLENGILEPFIASIGLQTSMKAPRVSIFQPQFMVNLILQYANEYTEIFDPFSGYSGRVLGTLAFKGKKYIGRDLNDITISESKNLLEWLNKNFPNTIGRADLAIADAFKNIGRYQCLITCGPYDDGKGNQVEEWMSSNGKISCELTSDEVLIKCLENYECDKYIFVTSRFSKLFDPYVKETFENQSYIQARKEKGSKPGINSEKVIVVTKNERDQILKTLQK